MKVNISIDDVSPHPRSSQAVVERCHEIIKVFPDAKFTLFVPTAYWRTMGETSTKEALRLDKYPDFCEFLKELPSKNFEVAYHGLFHGIPGVSNNDEFKSLNFEETTKRFKMMEQIAKNAGVQEIFKRYFRPPAWKMSSDAIRAARAWGVEILALSPDEIPKATYDNEDTNVKDVVYYNVNPPFKPLQLHEKTEIVYHACEWDKNFLNAKKTSQLIDFLRQEKEKIDFCFIQELL